MRHMHRHCCLVVDTFHRTLSIPPEKMVKFAACLEEFFSCREAIPSPRSLPRCTVASNTSSCACHTSTRMSPSCPPSSDASRTQTTIALSLSLRSSERLLSLSARYLRSSHSVDAPCGLQYPVPSTKLSWLVRPNQPVSLSSPGTPPCMAEAWSSTGGTIGTVKSSAAPSPTATRCSTRPTGDSRRGSRPRGCQLGNRTIRGHGHHSERCGWRLLGPAQGLFHFFSAVRHKR
jgi:hypothetical protein